MKKVIFAIMVLALAVLSFLAGGRFGKGQSPGTGSEDERAVLYYVDPMNPGFRSGEPGVAPCGMPLEPVYAVAGEGHENPAMSSLSPGAVKVSPAQQQLIGVKVAAVQKEPMTYALRLYGKVIPDETRVYRINASTDSWIRELSDATTGSIVSKNQILAEALAPAYFNAQVTYLIALDNLDRIKRQLGGELRHQQADLADNQIRVAVQALQNLGISDAQVRELANTREARPYLQVRAPSRGVVLSRNVTLYQWFKAGEEFYTMADIGKVWVYADVYENEARHLRPGMTVMVMHPQMGRAFGAKVSEVLPLFDPVSKTLKVRLDVENPNYDLRPDMFVDVQIPITLPESLHVPADAVIDSGTRTIVYVGVGGGIFEPRQVDTGWRLGRRIQITGGLMPGERVVVSGNFLIDSESRMKTAAAGGEIKTSKDPVCGMYVDREKAVAAGLTVRYAGKAYYFCSKQCVEVFLKEAEKYVKDVQAGGNEENHAVPPWIDRGGIGAQRPVTTSQSREHSNKKTWTETKDDFGDSSSSWGIVDWDGPETETNGASDRDWGAWGAFPGAQYLGLKHKTLNKSAQPQDTPEDDRKSAKGIQDSPAVAPAATTDVSGPEMEDGIQEQPAPDQSSPPANE